MPHALLALRRTQYLPGFHSIILSAVLVPTLSLSFSFWSVSIARASRLGGSQARIHVHTHAEASLLRSLFPSHVPRCRRSSRATLVCLFLVATTERSRRLIALPGPPARALSLSLSLLFFFFFSLLGSASPSPHCHESMGRAESTTKPLRVIRSRWFSNSSRRQPTN